MKRFTHILALAICLLTVSCSSILDKDPDFVTPSNYYNTEEEMTKALNGVYNRLIDTWGRGYSKGLYSFLVVSDEFFYRNITINNIRVMAFDAGNLDVGRFWEVQYEGVNRANLLLKNLEERDLDTDNKRAIKGEALFLRGYYYFLLTTFYGEVPLKLTPTESPSDNYLPKAKLADIYAQIVKDMKEAEELVHGIEAFTYNERITKTAVQAILARVYLKMAGEPLKDEARYADALAYANKVIDSGKHELNPDFPQIFINHVQDINESKECIWEIGMYGNKVGSVDLAGSLGVEFGILCPDESIGYSNGPTQVPEKLYKAFDPNDPRRDWCIAPYSFVADAVTKEVVKKPFTDTELYNRNPGKWRREYETGAKARSFTSTNFPVIRYSDVLLMKAEAENVINGPTDEAYDAINQVRRRGYGKPIHIPDATCDIPAGLDKAEFFQYLQNERYTELCFEGLRKLDLLRWGMYIQTMNEVGNTISTTAPSAFRYAGNAGKNTTARNVVFPIPNTEITVNKLMVQNEGW